MQQKNAKEILERYIAGTATEVEKSLVENWYESFNENGSKLTEKQIEEAQNDVSARLSIHQTKNFKLWPRISAAAAVLLLISTGGYYFLRNTVIESNAQRRPEQIMPKVNGIVLTMENGEKLNIDQHYRGKIKTAGGSLAYQSGNALIYQPKQGKNDGIMQTLTNNSGSKFALTLADGTETYLDSRSSITFPVLFTEKQRRVTITGQAYFKVKHVAAQPFLVYVKKQVVEDIGTEFNINAYDDEAAIKTTLLQGEVKINHTLLLKPGEQASFEDNELKKLPADMEVATAWLQGKIVFHHEPLESILNKVARVYDMQIFWSDESLKHQTFGGSVSRMKKLSAILNFFRSTGEVDFVVDGKTINVFKSKGAK